MKILIVCSGTHGALSPFIQEQIDSIKKLGIEVLIFKINKPGLIGYSSHLRPLRRFIKLNNPDIVHAHYGLSGLLANMQRKIPVITTFHGSDINNPRVFKFSKWAHILSAASIFVEEKMQSKLSPKETSCIIPCGVDFATFRPLANGEINGTLNIKKDCVNILFSSSFCNPVKNYPLAKEACTHLERGINKKVNLIELKGIERQQVNLLMNSVDCVLLTSFSEGSPQFIKEAMACNKPIVATNVGDIKWLFGNEPGHFLAGFESKDVAEKIKLALAFSKKNINTKGREKIIELGLDSVTIAKRIIEIYNIVLNK